MCTHRHINKNSFKKVLRLSPCYSRKASVDLYQMEQLLPLKEEWAVRSLSVPILPPLYVSSGQDSISLWFGSWVLKSWLLYPLCWEFWLGPLHCLLLCRDNAFVPGLSGAAHWSICEDLSDPSNICHVCFVSPSYMDIRRQNLTLYSLPLLMLLWQRRGWVRVHCKRRFHAHFPAAETQ